MNFSDRMSRNFPSGRRVGGSPQADGVGDRWGGGSLSTPEEDEGAGAGADASSGAAQHKVSPRTYREAAVAGPTQVNSKT